GLPLLFLLVPTCLAQQQPAAAHKFSPTSSRDKLSTNNSRSEILEQQRRMALLRVQGFTERAQAFHDPEPKIRTLLGMGDLLWAYDAPYARHIFEITQQYFNTLKADDTGNSPKLSAGKLLELRTIIVAAVARRDATLARTFAATATSAADRAFADQWAANNLLAANKVSEAVEFATRSLHAGTSRQMVGFLLRLRRQSEPQADELYLTTLSRLASEPAVDGQTLMEFGVYVFTAPFMNQELEDQGAFIMQSIGGVGAINLGLARPNASETALRAYLSMAADILARRVTDPQQQKLYYVTAYQLLPHAQRFAPELAPRFTTVLQGLTPDVPQRLTQASAYDELAPDENYTFDDTLREVDGIHEQVEHDQQAVRRANGLCAAGDFAHARTVAERVKDLTVRGKVVNLIAAAAAFKQLERGALDATEEAAAKLAPGIERALLWLAVARARNKTTARDRTDEAINAALKDVRRLDDARQPQLLFALAGEAARGDAAIGLQLLNEAVKALNGAPSRPVRWAETVEVGGRAFQFTLYGMNNEHASAAIRQLYAVDPQGTEAAVLNLKQEQMLGTALRALSEGTLAGIPKSKTP
ncbi:MAG TPA: hypothetical protein VE775_05725, partial [Pyrinomonadaceae bacterium]|nr:hypothetical protein [Pyrinomonadaceae bacterium]